MHKIGSKYAIEIVDYNTFWSEIPEKEKETAPPPGTQAFALYNPVSKRPRVVSGVTKIDRRLFDFMYHMLKHEFVHVNQFSRQNKDYDNTQVQTPTSQKNYFSDKHEIMAFSQSIVDILINEEGVKNINDGLKKLRYIRLYNDIKSMVDKDVLNRYHKYIYLYLKQELNKEQQKLNEDMMKFPDDEEERPHPDIQKRLAHKEDPKATPYSDIELFGRGEEGHDTKERLASKEYEELLKKTMEVGRITNMQDFDDLLTFLSDIESLYKPRLEALAKKVIQKELGLSQDIMDNITGKLLTQTTGEESVIKDFDKEKEKQEKGEEQGGEEQGGEEQDGEEREAQKQGEDKEDLSADDKDTPLDKLGLTQEEANQLVGEIQVRKIMNSMMMGGGYKLFDVLKDFKAELDAIDRRLYPLYIELNPNGNLMHWHMPPYDLGIRRPAGSVKLSFEEENKEEESQQQQPKNNGNQEKQDNEEENDKPEENKVPKVVKVDAKATNFAVLLHELAKGAMEYLFAIRLARFSNNLRRAIVSVADSYAEEHFHKLLGPQIWKQFFYGIEIALDQYSDHNEIYGIENRREMLPLIINKIATMKANDFMFLVDDMLNPGEAEKNRRNPPLDRIKNIIHTINMEIKEFMDSQNGEGGEINIGEPNFGDIDRVVNDKKDDWIDDLEGKINEPEEPEQKEPTQQGEKDYTKMDKNQLSIELADALDNEEYDLAAKLRDLINSK